MRRLHQGHEMNLEINQRVSRRQRYIPRRVGGEKVLQVKGIKAEIGSSSEQQCSRVESALYRASGYPIAVAFFILEACCHARTVSSVKELCYEKS